MVGAEGRSNDDNEVGDGEGQTSVVVVVAMTFGLCRVLK